jgi:hypothetical protein
VLDPRATKERRGDVGGLSPEDEDGVDMFERDIVVLPKLHVYYNSSCADWLSRALQQFCGEKKEDSNP